MMPFFTGEFGNAASKTHAPGWRAAEAVETARARVAALVGAETKDVVFTSGATEATNLALTGAFEAANIDRVGPHAGRDGLVTPATEHAATLDTARHLATRGARLAVVPVAPDGMIDTAAFAAAIDDRTLMASVLLANNETGVIQELAPLAAAAAARGALFHVDGVQAAGRVAIDMGRDGIDLLSISAHKMYGPKGIGALVVRRRSPRTRLSPIAFGGGHERGLRSGTPNVPGIVGFGEACRIAAAEMVAEAARVGALRDDLLARLREGLAGAGGCAVHVHGATGEGRRLANNLNVGFEGIAGESLIAGLRGLAVSAGSACASGGDGPSHVLTAMGVFPALAHASIRFGLGRFTTAAEIETAAAMVTAQVRRLKELAPR